VLYQLGHNQFSDMVIWTINLVYWITIRQLRSLIKLTTFDLTDTHWIESISRGSQTRR
jgi:hypothetical protein